MAMPQPRPRADRRRRKIVTLLVTPAAAVAAYGLGYLAATAMGAPDSVQTHAIIGAGSVIAGLMVPVGVWGPVMEADMQQSWLNHLNEAGFTPRQAEVLRRAMPAGQAPPPPPPGHV